MSGLEEPFNIGCYGPVESYEECLDLYSTCTDTGDGAFAEIDVLIDGSIHTINYDIE